jgi:hypothetical protein
MLSASVAQPLTERAMLKGGPWPLSLRSTACGPQQHCIIATHGAGSICRSLRNRLDARLLSAFRPESGSLPIPSSYLITPQETMPLLADLGTPDSTTMSLSSCSSRHSTPRLPCPNPRLQLNLLRPPNGSSYHGRRKTNNSRGYPSHGD